MACSARRLRRLRLFLMLLATLLILGLLAAMSLGWMTWSQSPRFARGIALMLLVFFPALALALGERRRQRRWPWH